MGKVCIEMFRGEEMRTSFALLLVTFALGCGKEGSQPGDTSDRLAEASQGRKAEPESGETPPPKEAKAPEPTKPSRKSRADELRETDAKIMKLYSQGKFDDGSKLHSDEMQKIGQLKLKDLIELQREGKKMEQLKLDDLTQEESLIMATFYFRWVKENQDRNTEMFWARLAERGGIRSDKLAEWRAKIWAEGNSAITEGRKIESVANANNAPERKGKDREAKLAKVLAVMKKAKERILENSKDHEEQSKSLLSKLERDDGAQLYHTIKNYVEQDLDLRVDLGPNTTVGTALMKCGFYKHICKKVHKELDDKDLEGFFVKLFTDVNPDVTVDHMVQCLISLGVSSHKTKNVILLWAKDGYDPVVLAADPAAKFFAKKFRGD